MTAVGPHPDALAEYTREAQERGCDPLTWAVQLSSMLAAAGAQPPSTELAGVLVSHLCWANSNVRLAWKYLDRALSAGLVPPVLVLALLSTRVIPCRKSRPLPYRLYLALLRMHAFNFASQIEGPYFKKIMASVDDVLHLSQAFGLQACELGVLVVEFVFCVLWQLVDATIEDEGLQDLAPERKTMWFTRQDMDIDREANVDERIEHIEKLQKTNIQVATELIQEFLHHKVISRLLSLARDNMPSQWGVFTLCLRVLEANSSSLPSGSLLQLAVDDHKKISRECNHGLHEELNTLISSESSKSSGGQCHGTSYSAIWIPLDLYLEDCIDLSVAPSNAIEILSGLIKALQVVNGTTWHDVFLGLWMASLRLVQRGRDPIEGPVPRLDSRLSMLLSITTLSVADVIEEEELALAKEAEYTSQWKTKTASSGRRRKDLVSSLQVLGDYESLLVPPSSVVLAANQAAAKATMFVSGLTVGSGHVDMININDKTLNFSGNMWHLIVEACISRNLLDTSAYYWPGYVSGLINQIPHSMTGQVPGWSAFMKGAPLTVPMVNALVATPASSLAELEKVFEIAVSGSDDDKISAATILCGASLISGWNVQEHTVRFALNLLSPPPPVDYSGSDSHLTDHGPVLYVVLAGISSVDCAQVFSYHGLVPELAGALMEICEVFGSYAPSISWTLASGEEITTYAVFSSAFILLMRLWQFNHPPLECCLMGDSAPVGSQLNPEYLLLQRNSRVLDSSNVTDNGKAFRSLSTSVKSASTHPIFVDSFPKLKVWYRQHQACLASTLSGLVHGTPVHKNVDALLNMMFRKVNKGPNQAGSTTSGSSSLSSSSGPGSEETSIRPKLPAWDIMEAVPFVVDAALTACAHGRLSPRELATGLKDLADFLPASLATIVSYFSAEVTRGIWKPAFMNGTDWPSPAANLSTVEELIKKILAATGVDVPSLVVGGSSPATLPLPLAAFVSFTITYKLDKASERFLNLAGPALESLAASCPWPSMPIVAALWTQKVKRWSDFLIFSASRTVFHHNDDAVVQLLRSCFTAMLDLSTCPLSSDGGVGSLLGHGFGSHFSGGISPVAPGVLYLRMYRCIKNVMILADEILSLLMWSVKEIALKVFSKERAEKLQKAKYGTRYEQVSLATAITRVRVAAALGATLVWLSGGPGLVQSLIHEILPSWFLSVCELDVDRASAWMVHKLAGCALAHFAVIGGIFAWGIGSSRLSKRRPKVLGAHMEFIARAFDGKISVGCDSTLWRTFVVCFLGLMVKCAPSWVLEIDSSVLRRLSWGLKEWDEDELALALLQKGGVTTMGAAAEMIILAGE